MRRKIEVFRDGKVHVLSRMCATCIFRPGNVMHLNEGRVEDMVEGAGDDGCIPCHEVMDTPTPAVCRGFYGAHRNQLLQIATRLNVVVFDDPPTQGDTP